VKQTTHFLLVPRIRRSPLPIYRVSLSLMANRRRAPLKAIPPLSGEWPRIRNSVKMDERCSGWYIQYFLQINGDSENVDWLYLCGVLLKYRHSVKILFQIMHLVDFVQQE